MAQGVQAGSALDGLAIDFTVVLNNRAQFERSHYTVDTMDLTKWLSEAEISALKGQHSEYAKCSA